MSTATSTTTTYAVEGMTCTHCAAAVTEEISAVPGVREVRVDLVAGGPSSVHVTSDEPIDPAAIAGAVREAGYVVGGPAAR